MTGLIRITSAGLVLAEAQARKAGEHFLKSPWTILAMYGRIILLQEGALPGSNPKYHFLIGKQLHVIRFDLPDPLRHALDRGHIIVEEYSHFRGHIQAILDFERGTA